MIIVKDTEKCTGCRACELACSYHHRQLFSPSIASIRIQRGKTDGKVNILLYQRAEKGHMACNCPEGKEACVNFCTEIARDKLRGILQSRGNDQ